MIKKEKQVPDVQLQLVDGVPGVVLCYYLCFPPLAGVYYFTDRRHQVPAFQSRPGDLHLQALQCHSGLCVSTRPGQGLWLGCRVRALGTGLLRNQRDVSWVHLPRSAEPCSKLPWGKWEPSNYSNHGKGITFKALLSGKLRKRWGCTSLRIQSISRWGVEAVRSTVQDRGPHPGSSEVGVSGIGMSPAGIKQRMKQDDMW